MPEVVSACAACGKPTEVCVCALLPAAGTRLRVLVLQHPQENDHLLGTAPLLLRGLARCAVRVGLSWSSLKAALADASVRPARWALVYPAAPAPGPDLRPKGQQAGQGAQIRAPVVPASLDGIVLLDGTWSQAKTLRWRNPWLGRLPPLPLTDAVPSIYGRLRREPRLGHRSTLEACVAALRWAQEPETALVPLEKALRTLAQRLRDQGRTTPSAPGPRPRRRPRPRPGS